MVAGVFERAPDGRVYNTAVAFDAEGRLAAAYRKIHLFDALGNHESELVAPGAEPVLAELAGLRVGFLTCYDVRFPELARTLAVRGADLIVIPAAWAAGLFKEDTGSPWCGPAPSRTRCGWRRPARCLTRPSPPPGRPPASAAAWSSTRWARCGWTSDPGPASARQTSTPS